MTSSCLSSVRITDAVVAWAARRPAALALADGTTALTYGELAGTIERLAGLLGELGIGPGDRIMVVGENSVALAAIILAGNRVGASLALENARRAAPEMAAILDHCRPRRAVFVFAGSAEAEDHARRLQARVMTDPVLGAFGVTEAFAPGEQDDAPAFAVMIYTTGTTGAPKGVMLTDGNLGFIAAMMARLRGIGPEDRVYCLLPITHVMGLASVLLGGLHNGAQVHLRARFSPERCLDDLRALDITCLQGATAMFAKLVERATGTGWTAPPGLRFTGAGGAPMDLTVKAKAERLFGTTLHNGYGLTEAASICWTRVEDGDDDDTVGRPLAGVELRLRHVAGQEVPPGAVGELWVRGPQVTPGYFRDPDLTRTVLTPDGWFNTQDLARIAPDGRVFVVGRAKDVIIRSGFKVNPLEVETVLNRHPGIAHSAVVGRAVEGNEEIVAFVELAPPASDLPADLREHLRVSLSAYKHPGAIVVLDSLPLAPNGKVLKAHLQHLARGLPHD